MRSISADRAFLDVLHRALEKRFAKRSLRVAQLARAVGISERHFQRRVRTLTGMTPARYLSEYRLFRACDYLRLGGAIGDVAHATGFSSHAYFAHRFKRRFGVTPSEFQRSARGASSGRNRAVMAAALMTEGFT